MDVKIEKNIPAPKNGRLAWWRKFEVGDSALMTQKQMQALSNGFRYVGWKLTRKKEGDLIRVWRIG